MTRAASFTADARLTVVHRAPPAPFANHQRKLRKGVLAFMRRNISTKKTPRSFFRLANSKKSVRRGPRTAWWARIKPSKRTRWVCPPGTSKLMGLHRLSRSCGYKAECLLQRTRVVCRGLRTAETTVSWRRYPASMATTELASLERVVIRFSLRGRPASARTASLRLPSRIQMTPTRSTCCQRRPGRREGRSGWHGWS